VKKNLDGQEGCSSAKQVERAHPQLVHWWLLVHSNLNITLEQFQKLLSNHFMRLGMGEHTNKKALLMHHVLFAHKVKKPQTRCLL
jgi:hypothetical protein